MEVLTFTHSALAPDVTAPTVPITIDGSSNPIKYDSALNNFDWKDATHDYIGSYLYKMKSFVTLLDSIEKDDYTQMRVDITCSATLT